VSADKIQSNLELTTISKYRPFAYSDHLPTATTIFESQFQFLSHKATPEQWPLVNVHHKFGVPRVVVVHRFDCDFKLYIQTCVQRPRSGVKKQPLLIVGRYSEMAMIHENWKPDLICTSSRYRQVLSLFGGGRYMGLTLPFLFLVFINDYWGRIFSHAGYELVPSWVRGILETYREVLS